MNIRPFLLAGAALLSYHGAFGQTTAPTVKVDVKTVTTGLAQTPQYQVTSSVNKSWRPKNWLEIDMALDVKKAKIPGDTTTLVDALEVKFYVGLNQMDANRKYILLTGTMNYINIPTKAGEHPHALAYVSPSTLQRLLSDRPFNATGDIKAVAVEISYGGQLIGGYPIGQGKWWEDLSKFSVVDGAILPKAKTPFAPLWGDYDLEVKQ